MAYLLICILCTSCLGLMFKYFDLRAYALDRIILVNYLTCGLIGWFYFQDNILLVDKASWFSYSIILGFLFILGFTLYAKSVVLYGLSLATVVQKLSVVITVVIAVFLGDQLTLLQWIGVGLTPVAFYFIFYKPKLNVPLIRKPLQSQLYLFGIILISSAIEILFIILNKKNFNIASFQLVLTTYVFIFAFGFALIYSLLKTKTIRISKIEIIAGVLLGIPNFFSIFYLNKALNNGLPGSILFPLLNCTVIIVSSSLGILLFNEPASKHKKIGLAFAILAIFLVSYFK